MSLDVEQIRWIAHLARLELADDEIDGLARDLNAIVSYMDQLQQLNTDGIEPLAHPLDVKNVFREDVPASSLAVDEALASAPDRRGNYFGVPAVLD
ncbi:MAG: Asp-tRNA(Asn)/Glu-tRNA(Gln) amidotransferase subunit GatC [Planctomycetes bacterium]|nr:Asp-tRNA(Asn)/Glu-tRNA(Gln) amidotransferase subunit GatC [Planctomycetota bacterium]